MLPTVSPMTEPIDHSPAVKPAVRNFVIVEFGVATGIRQAGRVFRKDRTGLPLRNLQG